MSANQAELTLIIRAQNLADAELAKVKTSLGGIATTAKVVATDVANSFKGIGKRIGHQFGNLAVDILSGGDIVNNLVFLGATMAGAIIEGLSAHFIPMLLEKIATSAAFAPVAAAFTAAGGGLGGILAAAIAAGTVALPFLLLAAAVAALVYLAANPEARQKARAVALMIIGKVGDGLRGLGVIIIGAFQTAFAGVMTFLHQAVYNVKLAFWRIYYAIKHIVDRIVKNIGNIVQAVRDAIAELGKLVPGGPSKNKPGTGYIKPHAAGGWVGLHGPELGLLGENGPEYITPNHRLGDMGKSGAGFTIAGISERELIDMVDRGLYFRLQRSAASQSRT